MNDLFATDPTSNNRPEAVAAKASLSAAAVAFAPRVLKAHTSSRPQLTPPPPPLLRLWRDEEEAEEAIDSRCRPCSVLSRNSIRR